MKLLKKHNFSCKKHLGQNFLIDQNILKIIIHSLEPEKEDCILEIGTGIGTLSAFLSTQIKQVISIEKDRKLIPIIKENLSPFNNIEVVFEDIMNFNFNKFLQENIKKGRKINKIVGNLPYYISIPLIRKIIELGKDIKIAVFLVQKEVGKRLMAQPGEKDYGILSIATQYYSMPSKVHIVPATVFYPKPKVNSMIIRLDIMEKPQIKVDDEKVFFEIVRASFQQRRKRIINSLANYFQGKIDKVDIENILEKTGIDKSLRGETLTLEEFAKLSNAMEKKLS
ncbi:MAG: 16S rRNA (adenine(1518)-N(6)/adenine(1519)-N(6))-dimethyltransferase RsmA [Candidatus Caldatribacteriota bacterium]|nr:16S rRNA (adenine(1518)-N(6)/adenine(1519)-N(6))-dimethyltransferase RsmA [Candidatus Caldatribacteriota bacterium]